MRTEDTRSSEIETIQRWNNQQTVYIVRFEQSRKFTAISDFFFASMASYIFRTISSFSSYSLFLILSRSYSLSFSLNLHGFVVLSFISFTTHLAIVVRCSDCIFLPSFYFLSLIIVMIAPFFSTKQSTLATTKKAIKLSGKSFKRMTMLMVTIWK